MPDLDATSVQSPVADLQRAHDRPDFSTHAGHFQRRAEQRIAAVNTTPSRFHIGDHVIVACGRTDHVGGGNSVRSSFTHGPYRASLASRARQDNERSMLIARTGEREHRRVRIEDSTRFAEFDSILKTQTSIPYAPRRACSIAPQRQGLVPFVKGFQRNFKLDSTTRFSSTDRQSKTTARFPRQ